MPYAALYWMKEPVWMVVKQTKFVLFGVKLDTYLQLMAQPIFTRGETQSLTSVTLGTKLDLQSIDRALYQGQNNFMLHYNFPAFSTGEVKTQPWAWQKRRWSWKPC